MRKLILASLLVSTLPFALNAQVSAQPRDTTISVSITRTGRATADRVSFYLGVEGVGENAQLALDRLQTKFKLVQDTIKRSSTNVQIDPPTVIGVASGGQNVYPPQPNPIMVARGLMRVTVTKVADISQIQLAASAAGVSITGTPLYESSQVDAVWQSKISEALVAARAAADISATAQGYKLGALLTTNVGGGSQLQPFQQQQQINFDSRNSFVQVINPDVPVNATVTITYLVIRK